MHETFKKLLKQVLLQGRSFFFFSKMFCPMFHFARIAHPSLCLSPFTRLCFWSHSDTHLTRRWGIRWTSMVSVTPPPVLLLMPSTATVTIVPGTVVTTVVRGIVVVATSTALAATLWRRRSFTVTTSVGMVLWTVILSVVVLALISTETLKDAVS